jgi:hypothetical protein
MISGKIFMNLVMLSIFAVMVGVATQYPPQARFMPLVVGIPGVVLCLFQLFLEIRGFRRAQANEAVDPRGEFERAQEDVAKRVGHKMDFEVAHEKLQIVESELPKAGETRREILLWACFIALIAGLILFGFWTTIPIFLIAFLHYYAKKGWLFSLGLGGAATAIFFVVFRKGLGIVLHSGFITEYLLDRFFPG